VDMSNSRWRLFTTPEKKWKTSSLLRNDCGDGTALCCEEREYEAASP